MTTSSETSTAFETDDGDDSADNIEEMFLTFLVQGTVYAACLAHVIEIVVGQRLLPVPDVPPFITGVINLRGRVVPVMDVGKRFGFPPQGHHERLCIMVVDVAGSFTGLAVDGVRDVVQIPAANIGPAIHHGGASAGFIRGIGRLGEEVIFIFDLHRLLEAGEAAKPLPNTEVVGGQ